MVQVFGPKELVEDVFNKALCIGCGACIDLCPYLKNHKGKTTQLFPCDLSKGRCYAYCPKAEVNLDDLSNRVRGVPYDGRPLGSHQKILASRAGKEMVKGSFQAGGTVSALVIKALEEGLIEAAVLTDRDVLTPVPRLVTSPKEVIACATSKFMASPTLSVINESVGRGCKNLGVVGTPCQLTALAQMRANPLEEEAFVDPVSITIGLFCNWSLDTRQLMALLSEYLDLATIQHIDIPPPPASVMVLTTDAGKIEIPLSKVKPLIPQTCFICMDMTSELSDLSVGMFEGRPGWNTLIVRSQKGADLIARAKKDRFLETEEMPGESVEHLAKAAADKKERSLRMLKKMGLVNTKDDKRSALRFPLKVVQQILR